MKLWQSHPLLSKYFFLQGLAFLITVGFGLGFVFRYVPHKKREVLIQEMVRACETIRRIEHDQNLSPAAALEFFIERNPKFFAPGTQIKPRDYGNAPASVCDPHLVVGANVELLQLPVDENALLETPIQPPNAKQIAMVAAAEGPHSYEIQHHHPLIFGVTPETLTADILVVFLILGILSSSVVGFVIYRRATRDAARILDQIKNGNLKARFPFGAHALTGKFNLMADEIESLVHQLREAESVRVKILQELTHDLKTPVAGLRSLLESIRDKHRLMSRPEFEEFVDTGINETLYFSRLVDDLLFMSGVQDPHFKSQTRRLDLVPLIRDELKMHRENVDVKVTFDSVEVAPLYGEEILIKRLVRNGFDNAFYFAETRVDIRVLETASHWRVEILDDGPGPSSEILAHFGTKRATRQVQMGEDGRISLGLGSVIMRKIAQSFNGDATLERGASGGTLLQITLQKHFV